MFEEKRSEGQEVARQMSKLLNSYGSQERKVFIEEMSRDHRTLQQNFTRLCVDWLRNLAGRESFDLDRNPLPFI